MADAQETAELVEQIRRGTVFPVGSTVKGEEAIAQIEALLRDTAHPDFETVLVAMDGREVPYPGVSGFREALSDWISPYEEFRLEIDEVIPLADAVVTLVRQVGKTKHGGVEVETPSATVWSLLDGRIRRAGFYLDQRAALEAAGLDPQSPQE